MWKAAVAFIVAIGAGGFVAGSVLGDPGGPPDVGDPVVVNDGGSPGPADGVDDTPSRPADDDGTDDRGHGDDGDDDDLDTVYHEPDDLFDDHGGDRDDNSGPGSDDSHGGGDDDNSGHGSDDSGGGDD